MDSVDHLRHTRGVILKKLYIVYLSATEREELTGLVKRGTVAAYRRRHAEILLLADQGEHEPACLDREIASQVGVTPSNVERIRKRCVPEGLEAALGRRKRSRERATVLDGEALGIFGYGRHGVRAVYLDDCASGTAIYGNVFLRCTRAVLIGGGRDNRGQNNLFVHCEPAIQLDGRGQRLTEQWRDMVYNTMRPRLEEMHHQEPRYAERYISWPSWTPCTRPAAASRLRATLSPTTSATADAGCSPCATSTPTCCRMTATWSGSIPVSPTSRTTTCGWRRITRLGGRHAGDPFLPHGTDHRDRTKRDVTKERGHDCQSRVHWTVWLSSCVRSSVSSISSSCHGASIMETRRAAAHVVNRAVQRDSLLGAYIVEAPAA